MVSSAQGAITRQMPTETVRCVCALGVAMLRNLRKLGNPFELKVNFWTFVFPNLLKPPVWMPSSRLAPTNLVLSLHSNTSATIDQLVLSLHSNTSATTDKSATTDSFCGFDRCGYYRITFSFLRTIFPSWTLPPRLQPLRLLPHHVLLWEQFRSRHPKRRFILQETLIHSNLIIF